MVSVTILSTHASQGETTPQECHCARIERAVHSVLSRSPYWLLRCVQCEVRKKTLILRGVVPSYFLKQMAQTLIRAELPSGLSIENQIEIGGPDMRQRND